MKLYLYQHCPYCVRTQMITQLKQLPIQYQFLANDDETTPISMIGKKMLPILQKPDASYMAESLDIVHWLDDNFASPIITGTSNSKISTWVTEAKSIIWQLTIPRDIELGFPEFNTESAKQYFTNKKQPSVGNFADNIANSTQLLQQLEPLMQQLDKLIISKNAVNGQLSDNDFEVFPLLWLLSAVKGINFPNNIQLYLTNMAQKVNMPLLTDKAI